MQKVAIIRELISVLSALSIDEICMKVPYPIAVISMYLPNIMVERIKVIYSIINHVVQPIEAAMLHNNYSSVWKSWIINQQSLKF